MNHITLEEINLKNHPTINEKWVQDIISQNPLIIGLGDIFLKDKEKIQQGAGRLDLLFQEVDSNKRYEVEIQLGKTDESHIIRTIEYWDIERRRFPQFEHCAVIIAENITSRFLNVISLFNGYIPIIAIQMMALKVGNDVSLVFTKIVDKMTLGIPDDEPIEETNRDYWVKKSSPEMLDIVDDIGVLVNSFNKEYKLNYNKRYIGFKINGNSNNFCLISPKKKFVWLKLKIEQDTELEGESNETEFEIEDYDTGGSCYWVKLTKKDNIKNSDFFKKYLEKCYKSFNNEE